MKSKTTKTNRNIITTILPITLITITCISTTQAGQPWDQTHKLFPEDAAAFRWFGNSVAVSGNTAVIGAFGDADNGFKSGSAYVFDITTGQQLFKLLPSDGAEADFFGYSVGLSGSTAVIGAYLDDDNGTDSGSAYIFDTNTGQQLFKLLPADGAANDKFGFSVAISGNIAVIGAVLADDNGFNSGSAYVFDTTTGQQLFELLPNDGAEGDNFGFSVAINGNTAIVGAHRDDDNGSDSGSAYVFDITTGQQLSKLLASDGSVGDNFGNAVAINGNTAVIGALRDSSNTGSAYLFDITTGQQLFKFHPADVTLDDNFGFSVAITDKIAVIGSTGNGDDYGSAYVFDTTTGQQLVKLLAVNGSHFDVFGYSVAATGTTAVIGAREDNTNGNASGSAYIFQQRTANLLAITPNPLIAQQQGTFSITHAIPSEQLWLLYSIDGLRQTFIRQLNVVVDIANPKLVVHSRKTDTNGNLQFILPMPQIQFPLDLWFQAAQHSNITNFVPTQLIP